MLKIDSKFCRHLIFGISLLVLFGGCIAQQPNEIVVYVALDREFSEPVLKEFEASTGIKVLAKYDGEANKTVGLANELMAEANRGQCDVFWNNEILHTLRLEQAGRLATYACQRSESFPPQFRSKSQQWYGFAARARVLIVNTNQLPDPADRPHSVEDLVNEKWKGNCGIARPLLGTSASSAAVWFSLHPENESLEFFERIKANCVVEGGNKQVARNVAAGKYAWGITDTDDAIIELEHGEPVAIVFPDQGSGEPGTLLIPNTVCILKNAPHEDQARKLVDFLLSAQIESQLCSCPSAQIPLALDSKVRSRISPENLNTLQVDFEKASKCWEYSNPKLIKVFQ